MSRTIKIIFITALCLLTADALMQVLDGGAGDKEWLLLAAHKVIEGKTLYVDIFEVDPPLIIWLLMFPAWLSLHFPLLRDYQWLTLIGLILSACVVALSVILIRQHPAFAGNRHRQIVFALLVAYTLVFFSTQVYFFDRDHIFFVLVFPYLLRLMPSLRSQRFSLRLRLVMGVFAGIGFCIKPHTAVVFAIIQAVLLLRDRSLKALWHLENAIILLCAAIYLVCAWYYAPEYFHTVLPMAMAAYSGFSRRINAYLFLAIGFVSVGLTFADFRARHKTPYRTDVYYFIGLCIAFLAYAQAGNGWGYTYNPLLCTLLFLSGWVFLEYRWLACHTSDESVQSFKFGMRSCALNWGINILYIALCIGMFFFGNPCSDPKGCKPDPYAHYLKENHIHSFSTMSMNLRRWTWLTQGTGWQWDSRFNCLWMLPKLMQAGPEAFGKYRWITEYVAHAYAQDLENLQPDIVFVDRSDVIFNYSYPVDIPGFLSAVPEFKRVWSRYRRVSTIDVCEPPSTPKQVSIDCRFDIYSSLPQLKPE